jgi:hypothetical protein
MHEQRKVSNGEEKRKNGGRRNVIVTAMEHSSVCKLKHTKNIKW